MDPLLRQRLQDASRDYLEALERQEDNAVIFIKSAIDGDDDGEALVYLLCQARTIAAHRVLDDLKKEALEKRDFEALYGI